MDNIGTITLEFNGDYHTPIETIVDKHYPPEAFMTKKQRKKYFEGVKEDMKNNPEKYPFGDVFLAGRLHEKRNSQ